MLRSSSSIEAATPAAAGPLLILQDHPGGTDPFQVRRYVAGDLRIDIAIIDVDQQVLLGKGDP